MSDLLTEKCTNPGFTPSDTEVSALIQLLAEADAKQAPKVIRALTQKPEMSAQGALRFLSDLQSPTQANIFRLLGSLIEVLTNQELQHEVKEALLKGAASSSDKNRRYAYMALEKSGATDFLEEKLLSEFAEETPPNQKVILQILGRIGTAESDAFFQKLKLNSEDLKTFAEEAKLMLHRRKTRQVRSRVSLEQEIDPKCVVELSCLPGLESFLIQETGTRFQIKDRGEGWVRLTGVPTLKQLMELRIYSDFSFVFLSNKNDWPEAVVECLTHSQMTQLLRRLTQGDVRFRLELHQLGMNRAKIKKCVQELSAKAPDFTNDSRERTWDVHVSGAAMKWVIRLQPRMTDSRFWYRKELVAGSSHAPLAAALARLAGVDPNDRCWDPFAGAGAELAERALAGPYKSLIASDIDEEALRKCQQNLSFLPLEKQEFHLKDATKWCPRDVSLVITNPPLGKRYSFGKATELLTSFLKSAATCLVPGGRLVWVCPQERLTRLATSEYGFRLTLSQKMNLGGLTVMVQRLDKPMGLNQNRKKS